MYTRGMLLQGDPRQPPAHGVKRLCTDRQSVSRMSQMLVGEQLLEDDKNDRGMYRGFAPSVLEATR
jgi:hypothetical protein